MKYEKFLIPGQDSLLSIYDFSYQNHFFISRSTHLWNSDERLKWYGIEPLEENEAKKIKGIYGEDCKCNFDLEGEFKCGCDWNEQITLKEHKSFQDLRLVSKRGIYGQPNMAIDQIWESQVFMDPF